MLGLNFNNIKMELIEAKDIIKFAPFKRPHLYYLFKQGKLKKHVKEIKITKTYFDLEELKKYLKDYKNTHAKSTRSNDNKS